MRRKGGRIVRSEELMANPAARFVELLTDVDLTRMVGLDPKSRDHRYKTREALKRLHRDKVIDLRQEDGRWRISGTRRAKR